MQYALVNNIKSEPVKGANGVCPGCRKEVIAKCGKIKIHHWAHKTLTDCDNWWEPETEWHREWKNKFPAEYREIPFFDEKNNEYHRADIHTPNGVTIEFQNSPISIEELQSRDAFYSKLIWVVNAAKFKKGFTFTRQIPWPDDPRLKDFEIAGLIYFKKEDILNSKEGDLLLVYGSNSPELKDVPLSEVHFAFEWKNPHKAWFNSSAPMFFDFGGAYLYRLKKREQIRDSFWYVKMLRKLDFITKYSNY